MSNHSEMMQIVTGNRLSDGLVVFMTTDGTWSQSINDAMTAADDGEVEILNSKALLGVKSNIVVDPYLIETHVTNDGLRAAHIREHMRANGPSIRYRNSTSANSPLQDAA